MNFNWNSLREGSVKQKPSTGLLWIFSGSAYFAGLDVVPISSNPMVLPPSNIHSWAFDCIQFSNRIESLL